MRVSRLVSICVLSMLCGIAFTGGWTSSTRETVCSLLFAVGIVSHLYELGSDM
jgi:hypothetical protein